MSLLAKFSDLAEQREALLDADPSKVVIDEIVSPTEAVINGRHTILAGTNNYLGLTFDPDCIAAGQAALARLGTGTTGSRMANGNYSGHRALERELAEFYGYPYAMVFTTGYAANLGVLSALLGPEDAVLLDADAHASLYDGASMTRAGIYRFKHNDPDSLDKRLSRLKDRAARTLVVTEGLYSVLGDTAPLPELVEVTQRHDALLMVDEAHSLGVYGEHGRGVVESSGVLDEVDFVVGTFSKSLASTGGFCVSRHEELSLFQYASRPYMFTASPCPSVIATTRAALHALRTRPELKAKLWHNAERLYGALKARNLRLGPELSPVVAVRLEDRGLALNAWQRLLESGVYCNLMLPPAVPEGGSVLRFSLSAAHTDEQVDTLIERIVALGL
ncbi:MAG: aminotransferase class I/II-fold pyridoxal phosphate-dependent enzyme [Pseudomonadales bacterium]|jgi:8-amino-7-oxononanoate synthase